MTRNTRSDLRVGTKVELTPDIGGEVLAGNPVFHTLSPGQVPGSLVILEML